jgi:hypothetical protein
MRCINWSELKPDQKLFCAGQRGGIDARDAGRTAEVIFATKVEGELVTVTIRLSYGQAATLADLLEPFRKNQ